LSKRMARMLALILVVLAVAMIASWTDLLAF
jgi:hypothetical protein